MADPIVIQCPTCSKKFKLPGKPPAVFTCTGCSTPMDLSGFRAAAEPAAAPARAPRDSAKTGMAGRSASKVAARGAAGRMRRKRAAEDAGADDGEDAPRGAPPKKDNSQMLIIGSLVGLVVIGGLALVIFQKKKGRDETAAARALADAEAAKRKAAEDEAAANAAILRAGSAKPAAGTTPAAPGAPAAGAATAGAGTGTAGTGTGSGTSAMDAPPPPAPSKGGFHAVDHHPDATADEKAKIDELIQKAVFESAGRDSLLAGDDLVKFGVKASPRLINVFTTVKNAEGFGDRIGKSKVSVADKLLRRIDGYQERKRKNRQPITAASDEKYADAVAKAWVLWWDREIWKSAPEKPWDERVDGAEEEARKNGGEVDKGGTPDGGK